MLGRYALILAAIVFPRILSAEPQFENPPILSAKEILEPRMLKSKTHEVQDRVTNNGYLNIYQLSSPYGMFDAHGTYLLRERIIELKALAELKRISSSEAFLHAAKDTGVGFVTGTVDTVEKVADLAINPDKAVDTIKKVPDGVSNIFSWAARNVEGAAARVQKLASDDEEQAEEELASDAKEGVTSQTLSYLGYSEAEKKWYRKLGVNPSTDNQVLKDEITRLASVETAVGVGSKFVPMASLSVIDDINSLRGRAEQIALYEDPEKERIAQEQLIASLRVSPETSSAFFKNGFISPPARAIFLSSIKGLQGVENRNYLIDAIAQLKSREGVIYYVRSTAALMRIHTREPLKEIIASFYLPAAVTKTGKVVIPLAVDYLVWTKNIARIFQDFKAKISREVLATSGEILIAGHASPRCRVELERLGAVVREDISM